MSQKKEGPESNEKKPGVKIQDLTPSKDAKGGATRNADGGVNLNSTRNQDGGINADGGLNQNATKNLD